MRGERVPEALRGQMKAMMDARIDRDLEQVRPSASRRSIS